jgi:hypothetical protein
MNTLADQFASFHARNPNVYRKFCQLTIGYLERGRKVKSGEIMDLVRTDKSIKTTTMRDVGGKKVDNNYTSFYARKFNDDFPEHGAPFRVNKRKVDQHKEKVSFYDH